MIDPADQLDELLSLPEGALTRGHLKFIDSFAKQIAYGTDLTPKQLAVLNRIYAYKLGPNRRKTPSKPRLDQAPMPKGFKP